MSQFNVLPKLESVDKTLTDEQRKLLRHYQERLDAIEGYHFENRVATGDTDSSEAEVTVNFVRRYIQKLTRFVLGDKGFTLDTNYDKYEEITLPYLNTIWDKNNRKVLATSMLNWGGSLGDVYVVIEPSKRMLSEKLLDKKQAKRIQDSLTMQEWLEPDFILTVIPANEGFPYYKEDKKRPLSDMIYFEYKSVRPKPKKEVMENYPKKSQSERAFLRYADFLEKRGGKKDSIGDGQGANGHFLYQKKWYADRIEEWIDNEKIETYKLDYGIVPVVHIPNKIKSSNTPYGDDDITDIIPLNYELNYKASDVSEIINYYQSPLTLFFGVGLDQVEKGSDRILTGLPNEAKVQNLEMKGDLGASINYINFLRTSMMEVFGITENALAGTSNISNTSGVALHMQYEPLMERKQEKVTYLDGIAKINSYIIYLAIFYQRIKKMNYANPLDAVKNEPELFETIAYFPNTLPKDEALIIQMGNSKIQTGLGTREDVLRELGEQNPQKKLQEIEADQIAILKLNLIKALVDNIAKDGINPQALKTLSSSSNTDGETKTNFAGFLNDPMIQNLLELTADKDRFDQVQKAELEMKTGTKEMKRASGKVQSIV